MPKFRRKPNTVEAVTFDELVAHGIAAGANLHNGIPWSFDFAGHRVTHENDDCYLVSAPEDEVRFDHIRFERGRILVVGDGCLHTQMPDIFEANYEPLPPPRQAKLVVYEHWQALYIDDKLVAKGYMLKAEDILSSMGVTLAHFSGCDESAMEYGIPADFKDVKLDEEER